jgi:serine/threonine protein kinase
MNTIGNYSYNYSDLIGTGSFSKVYKGYYNNLEFAIKIINLDNLAENVKISVMNEVSIMNFIKNNPHENIIKCYDIFEEKNNIYIILEYCSNGDLSSILTKPIKEKYVKFYFKQLLKGLQYLNNNNIFHRDIKPKNILLTHKCTKLKIADFGFSKITNNNDLYKTICGSPMYMSPELLKKSNYNDQSDLWSIGIILFEMLYGYHPLKHSKNFHDIKKNIYNINIPQKNSISSQCYNLLDSLLKVDSSERMSWSNLFNNPWFNDHNEKYTNIPKTCVSNVVSLDSTNIKFNVSDNNIVNNNIIINDTNNVNNTNVNNTDMNNMDVNNTDVSDTNVNDMNDMNVNNTDVSDTNVNNMDVNDMNVNNTDVSDTNVNYMNVNNTDVSDTNVNNMNVNNTDVSDTNVNYMNVNNTDENITNINNICDMNIKDKTDTFYIKNENDESVKYNLNKFIIHEYINNLEYEVNTDNIDNEFYVFEMEL